MIDSALAAIRLENVCWESDILRDALAFTRTLFTDGVWIAYYASGTTIAEPLGQHSIALLYSAHIFGVDEADPFVFGKVHIAISVRV